MRNNCKKIISLGLVLSILLVYPINSFAQSQDEQNNPRLLEVEHDYDLENSDSWETYDEIDGVNYYFKDAPEYTVNIIKSDKEYIYIKDKKENSLKVYKKDLNVSNTDLRAMKIERNAPNLENEIKYEDIKSYVANADLKEEYNVSDFDDSLSRTAELRSSDAQITQRIDKKLSEKYGSPYSNKFIDSMKEQGKEAKLYQSMHFERYKYHNWWLDAGTAVGVVATLTTWPASTIAAVCAVFTTSTGVISLVNSFNSYEYVANAHWNKEVKVGSTYPYRSGKTVKGRVLLGDVDAAYRAGKTKQNNDYDDNKALMKTGIKNFIQFN